MTALPDGYTMRAPRDADTPAVAGLIRRAEEVDEGEPQMTEEEISIAQRSLDLERDVRVVEDGSGAIVATYAIRPRLPPRIEAFVAVDPAARGRGLGAAIAGAVESRAREILAAATLDGPVALAQSVGEHDEGGRALLERLGYRWVRRFWGMEIDLAGELEQPAWADGISLATLADGIGERAAFDAMEDAFADHWGFVPHDYAEWRAWSVERESFDPTLWFLALDGDEIAGGALCAVMDDVAWVNVLGVRRPWRRRGIGVALLLQSFAEFRHRGYPRAVLFVDSENPTGATRLYERAGMRVARQSDAFHKELAA